MLVRCGPLLQEVLTHSHPAKDRSPLLITFSTFTISFTIMSMNSFVTLLPVCVTPCGKQVRPGSPVVTMVINNSFHCPFTLLLPLNLTATLLVGRVVSFFSLPARIAPCHFSFSPFLSLVENIGFEPMTPCLQSRCSSQLS